VLARAALATLLVALGATTAQAETYGIHGHIQHRFERLSDFALDADRVSHEQPYRHTFRVRVGGKMNFTRDFWITSTVQLIDGQVLGAESAVPSGPRGEGWTNTSLEQRVLLRESALRMAFGLGTVYIGRRPVRWGMGLVLHDGEAVDQPFDDARGGDIVNGVWLDTTPMLAFGPSRLAYALRVGLGGDIVEHDEIANRSQGDLAWRLAGSIGWDEPWLTGGLYVMMHTLKRSDGETAERLLVDSAWKYTCPFTDRFEFVVEGEAAMITGSASGPTLPASTGLRQTIDIRAMAAVTRATLSDQRLDSEYVLEVGYASGDSDPDDSTDTTFRFDPARRVGMLIFDELLSRMSAQSVRRERERAPNAPTTWWREPTDGAVTSAVYVAPYTSWRLWGDTIALHLGGVIAFAPEPLYALTPQTELGAEAIAGPLGYELNSAATVKVDMTDVLTLSLGTQYGVFFPGPALSAVTGQHTLGAVHKWRLLADVSW
jgi:hypothetical protein